MSEPLDPKRNVLINDGPDQIFEFEVEMIPDWENIEAVIAWSKAREKSNDPNSAGNDADTKKSSDPDRPAA